MGCLRREEADKLPVEDAPCRSPHGDRVWIQQEDAACYLAVVSRAVVSGTSSLEPSLG